MKIPFDIKYRPQIESGEYKVETRDGRPARIICWDREDSKYPIIFLDKYFSLSEPCFSCTISGHANISGESQTDLFLITPEPELSEFELKVHEILYSDKPEYSASDPESWKHAASELLSIAKKELEKDLPRWRRWGNGACGNGQGIPIAIVKRGLNSYKLVDALGITGEQYIMLSDLEKLPKED